MKAATYIIGEPGVGKSTLVGWLTEGLSYEETDSPFAFRRYDCGVTELGRRREAFSGTDALAMDVQPKVAAYIEAVQPRLLLAEGDRLANGKFFAFLKEQGYDLTIYALTGARAAERQRAQRGSHQDATWLAGRQTKVQNLVFGPHNDVTVVLEAGMPSDYYYELMADRVCRTLVESMGVMERPL